MSKKLNKQYMSQAAYARHHGVSRQRISALVKEGRVVLVDGQVDVKASDRQLLDTLDPVRGKMSGELRDKYIDQETGDNMGIRFKVEEYELEDGLEFTLAKYLAIDFKMIAGCLYPYILKRFIDAGLIGADARTKRELQAMIDD